MCLHEYLRTCLFLLCISVSVSRCVHFFIFFFGEKKWNVGVSHKILVKARCVYSQIVKK